MKKIKSLLLIASVFVLLMGSAIASFAQQAQEPKLATEQRLVAIEGGTAKLINGRVTISFNENTLKQVKDNNYMISLTPGGDCGQLKVQQKANTEFIVQEYPSATPSNGSFDYVVFIKKTIYKGLVHETGKK